MRRKEKESLGFCRSKILFPGVVNRHVEMRPVIEPRTGYIAVVEGEAKRPHEMKRHSQPYTEPTYRPRVMRDFRAKKDD